MPRPRSRCGRRSRRLGGEVASRLRRRPIVAARRSRARSHDRGAPDAAAPGSGCVATDVAGRERSPSPLGVDVDRDRRELPRRRDGEARRPHERPATRRPACGAERRARLGARSRELRRSRRVERTAATPGARPTPTARAARGRRGDLAASPRPRPASRRLSARTRTTKRSPTFSCDGEITVGTLPCQSSTIVSASNVNVCDGGAGRSAGAARAGCRRRRPSSTVRRADRGQRAAEEEERLARALRLGRCGRRRSPAASPRCSASDASRAARTLTRTQSPACSDVPATTVGTPCDQSRNSRARVVGEGLLGALAEQRLQRRPVAGLDVDA